MASPRAGRSLALSSVPGLFYLALALLIMGPLMTGGYILTLDMVFGPEAPSPHDLFYGFQAPVLGAKLVPQLVIGGLGVFMPAWAIQKVILVATLTLAGIGAHRLVQARFAASRYFAGILYVVNPFVYVRFLSGQWYILLAYAVAPFAIKGFMALLDRPGRGAVLRTLALTSLVAVSSHMAALTLIAYLAIYAFWVAGRRVAWQAHAYLAALAVAFCALNAYWIAPALTADNSLLQALSEKDLEAFAPTTVIVSPVVSIATMHGFWREGYEYAVTRLPPVALAFGVFLWLALYGFLTTYRSRLTLALAALAVTGFVLGSGISGPFAPLFRFLADNLPMFEGFRDSHKFVYLLVLAYVWLGALGVETLAAEAANRRAAFRALSRGAIGLALAAPAIYTFTMFWGFNSYLNTADYPAGWREARKILDAAGKDAGVLALPWDSYVDYAWVPNRDRAVRTLARAYFQQPLVYPKLVIRRGGIYSQSSAPEQAFVKGLVDKGHSMNDFGAKIAPLGAKYVLLNTSDRESSFYRFLYSQRDLELVLDSPTIALFKNLNEVSTAYLTDSPELSGTLRPAEAERLSATSYKIEGADSPYVVFVPPNRDSAGWRLRGQPPVSSEPGYLGVYRVEQPGDLVLTYRPFYFNMIWYAVSAATLALAVAYALIGALKKAGWRISSLVSRE